MTFIILLMVVLVSASTAFRQPQMSPRFALRMMNSDNMPGLTNSNPSNQLNNLKRNSAAVAASIAFFMPLLANAADTTVPPAVEKVDLGPPPVDFGIKSDYYADCQRVVNHIRYAIQLEKGNPVLPDIAQKTKDEMGDFVSFYRRFNGVNGKQSFSLLYTSINVLAGHYTSYGIKFPVPEKRRKRLLQELLDIEKNIRKKR